MGFLGIFGFGSQKPKSEAREQSKAVTFSPFTAVEGRVIAAFSKVRQDITLLSSWTKYLKHKDMMHEQRYTKTQRELGVHKTVISGIKNETAELKAAIKELREELKHATQVRERTEPGSLTNLIRTKSEPNPDLKRTYFENKVVSMLRSRRKDYVLKQIMQLAATGTHSTKEIEEIVVGEKALCGRTAFYDYLKELKHKRMIMHAEKGAKKIITAENRHMEEVR